MRGGTQRGVVATGLIFGLVALASRAEAQRRVEGAEARADLQRDRITESCDSATPPASCGELLEDECPWRRRTHLYLGGRGVSALIAHRPHDSSLGLIGAGAGFGVTGGLRLGPAISLELNWSTTWHHRTPDPSRDDGISSLVVMSYLAGIKIHLPTEGPVDLFLLGAGGYTYVGSHLDLGERSFRTLATGPTVELGGGMDLWLGRHLSIGGQLVYRGMWLGDSHLEPHGRAGRVGFLVLDVNLVLHL